MAQTIKLKRSGTQNAVPSTSQLALGEVALNTYDGKMYIKKSVGGTESIVEIGGDATSSSGLDFTGNLNLADNVRIVIGDGNDLQIWHSGSDSIIRDSGTGGIKIDSNYTNIRSADGTETAAKFLENGAVELYHNNSKKFETTSSGIQVQGAMAATTGAYSPVYYGGSSSLQLKSNTGEMFAQFTNNGAAELYHDNALKLATLSTGVTVTGDITLTGNVFTDEGFYGNRVWNEDNSALRFATNNTERMRIDSSGNVGIGTTSPAHKLRVAGLTSLNNIIHKNGNLVISSAGGDRYIGTITTGGNGDSSGATLTVYDGHQRTTRIIYLAIRNGGGTNSLGYSVKGAGLSTAGDIDIQLKYINRSGAANKTDFYLASSGGKSYTQIYSWEAEGLNEDTGHSSTGATTIDLDDDISIMALSNGNVGIGNTSPGEKLEVTGTIKQTGTYNLTLSGGANITGSNHVYIKANSSYVRIGAPNNSVYYDAGTDHVFRGGDSTEYMRIDTNGTNAGNVGIGTSSPDAKLVISSGGTTAAHSDTDLLVRHSSAASTTAQVQILSGNTGASNLYFSDTDAYSVGGFQYNHSNNYLAVRVNAAERMRIDSSGNVLVGKTSTSIGVSGLLIEADGKLRPSMTSDVAADFNRLSTDGAIIGFRKDGSTVGSIGSKDGDLFIGTDDTRLRFVDASNKVYPANASGNARDNAIDLGNTNARFKDLYLAGQVNTGTISSGNITTTGYLRGPSTFTIDPAAHGDDTGTVVIAGNLQVDGTTTTINSTTLTVDDKNITLASGSVNAAAANGAGITVDCGSGTDATFSYQNTGDRWTLNKPLHWNYATATTALSLNNNNIVGVNNLAFADPGANEGLQWSNIRIFESPNDLSNTSGNLQVTYGGTRRLTIDNTGASINGNLGVGTDSPQAKVDVRGVTWTAGSGDGTIVQKLGVLDNNANTSLFNIYTDDAGSTRGLGGDALEFNTPRYGQVIGATRGSAAGGNVRSWKFITSTNSNERGVDLILYSQGDSSATGSTGTAGNVQISATSNRNSYINTSGNFGLGTASPARQFHVQNSNVGIATTYGVGIIEAVDAQLDLTSNSSGTWGSAINLVEGVGSSNTDVWSIVRQTTGGSGDSSLRFNFGTTNQHTNSNKVTFTSDARVGIGTDAPAAPLHVKHASGEAKVIIQAGSNTSSAVLQFGDSLDTSRGGIEYTSTDDMAFFTNNMTEAMRIRYTGNVGIGTSSPQQKVHASGTGITYFRATGGTGNTGIDFGQHSNGSGYIWHRDAASLIFGTDSTERLRLAATGAITFNEAFTFPTTDGSANQVLKTDGSGNVTWATEAAASASTSISDADGDTKIQVEEGTDDDTIRFDTAGSQRMMINSSGRVRINNDNSSWDGLGTLLVKQASTNVGIGIVDQNSSNTLQLRNNGTYSEFYYNVNNPIVFSQQGGERMRIDSSGNVGIGTTSPNNKLTVTGAGDGINLTGSGAYLRWNSGDMMIKNEGSYKMGFYTYNSSDAALNRRMVIDTNGNVGIGTNSPAQKLDVQGNVVVGSGGASDYNRIYFKRYGGASVGAIGWHSDAAFYIGGHPNYGSGAGNTVRVYGFGSNLHLGDNSNGDVLTVQYSSGNVGIGTSSPQAKVQVAYNGGHTSGNISINQSNLDLYNPLEANTDEKGAILTFSDHYQDSNGYPRTIRAAIKGGTDTVGNTANGFLAFYTDSGSANSATERMRIDSSGYVGIGTNNPIQRLQVAGSIYANGGNIFIDSGNRLIWGNSQQFIEATNSGPMQFGTGNAERMRIDSSGNVGIGTTNPSLKLVVDSGSVNHVAQFKSTDNSALISIADNDTTVYVSAENARGSFGFYTGTNTSNLNINSNGNVGIGTNSLNAKLNVEELGIDTTTTSTSATTQVAIDTFAAATFRSARYTIQVTNSTDSTYHITEILLIHDGTTPQITEYGTIFTGSAEATFDADISSGNVRLLATPASTDSMTFKVVRHCITV